MSELRSRLAAELKPWLGEAPLRSPRDLSETDLVAFGPPESPPACTLAEATRRQSLWNFRFTPLALHSLLSWQPTLPARVPPPQLSAAGNLGAARAHLLGACLGRLGRDRPLPLGPASGSYLDPYALVATHPGQPVLCNVLGEGHPLERALGRARRLRQEITPPQAVEMEGLTPAERELLVRLEQFSSIVASGWPHRLAAYAQDLARRLDAFYAGSRLCECSRQLAVFRAAARGLEAAAELLGLSDKGDSLWV